MCDRFGLVLELVSQALGQDDRNEYEKAYENYLKSLDAIAASLLKDYDSHGIPETPVPVNNAKKVISVARQCLDRVEKILGTSLNQFYAEQERCNETYSCPITNCGVGDFMHARIARWNGSAIRGICGSSYFVATVSSAAILRHLF
ncbi:hypothetical protein MRX96_002023 [Rhipicephalus microplus]